MLVGSYKNSVDTKGRVFLPAKFRGELGEKVIIVKGAEKCLTIYTEEKYLDFIETLRRDGEIRAKKHLRFLSMSAASVEIDVQGRIILPIELREYAELEKEVLFVGMFDTVEMWNEENAAKSVEEESSDKIDKELAENGY